jgi:ribosomal protein S18 acetylase RimI-like enzyme
MTLKIKLLTKENSSTAACLIESGLKEYFPNYDSKYNPDLLNLYDYYNKSRNIFLVGMINDTIVATGGLILEKNSTGRIVRMSIKKEYRRRGYATKILKAIEKKAFDQGYKIIVLETTKTWQEAISFYQRNNYKVTSIKSKNIHFKKSIVLI